MDLMNDNNLQDGDHRKHRIAGNDIESNKEEIFPSYDFQPIRPKATVSLSHSALDLAGSVNSMAARAWAASEPKLVSTSSARSYGSLDSLEPSKLLGEKDRNALESTIIFEIDQTMKKHADNLLHAMEGVSARLTQLETRNRNLENLVDNLKVSVGNSHGNTDGKMRQLENILLEVQSGVELLKDKQEIVEAQLQLSKFRVSKVNPHPEINSTHVEPTAQPSASLPLPHITQQPPLAAAPPSPPQQSLPPQSSQQYILPPPSQHSLPPPSSELSQHSNQFSPQQEPYFPPSGHSQPPPPLANQPPYQAPPPAQSLQPPHQPPYQSPPQQPQYPQQAPPQIQQLPSGYNPEEPPPYPLQSYPSNPPRQPPSHPAPGTAPSQQYYNAPPPPPSMYDGLGGRSNAGFPSGYSSEPYPYTGASQFGNTPSVKTPQQSGSGTGYPQLPMSLRFVFLSDSCIPLYSFRYTYNYIMSTPTSFVDSFADTKDSRYNPRMNPIIPVHNWRKGSQWVVLSRKHAEIVVNDTTVLPAFQQHCRRKSLPEFWRDRPVPAEGWKEHNCIPDEHYVQTLLAQKGVDGELTRRSLTYSAWDLSSSKGNERRGWHPMTYKFIDATLDLIKSIKGIDNINYETEYRREWCSSQGKPSPCFLFARKFTRPAALRLLQDSILLRDKGQDN